MIIELSCDFPKKAEDSGLFSTPEAFLHCFLNFVPASTNRILLTLALHTVPSYGRRYLHTVGSTQRFLWKPAALCTAAAALDAATRATRY